MTGAQGQQFYRLIPVLAQPNKFFQLIHAQLAVVIRIRFVKAPANLSQMLRTLRESLHRNSDALIVFAGIKIAAIVIIRFLE